MNKTRSSEFVVRLSNKDAEKMKQEIRKNRGKKVIRFSELSESKPQAPQPVLPDYLL